MRSICLTELLSASARVAEPTIRCVFAFSICWVVFDATAIQGGGMVTLLQGLVAVGTAISIARGCRRNENGDC